MNGATVDAFDRNTTTPNRGTTTTNASGYFTLTIATQGRYDIRVTNGSSISFMSYDDEVQLDQLEVATIRILNPAFTFVYTIVAGAITADRTMNLPVVTGTDTFAVLGLAQAFTARQLWAKGADIASAATITPGTDGNFFDITGTTGITAIATLAAGSIIIFQFDGALTITHNATTLILQGAVNLTTAAGDVVAFISEGAGNWRELWRRLAASPASIPARATQAAIEAETNEATYVSPNFVKNSPGTAKAWCFIDGVGGLETVSYNVTSVTDNGVGDATINLTTAFSTASYKFGYSASTGAAGNVARSENAARVNSSTFQTFTNDAEANVALDIGRTVVLYGDQ